MLSDLPLKISTCITLDTDVAEEIRKLSRESVRSFSQYVNLVLKRHIQEIEKGREKIL